MVDERDPYYSRQYTQRSDSSGSSSGDESSGSGDCSGSQSSHIRSLTPPLESEREVTSARDIAINPSDMFWNNYACLMIGGTVFAGLVWIFK